MLIIDQKLNNEDKVQSDVLLKRQWNTIEQQNDDYYDNVATNIE